MSRELKEARKQTKQISKGGILILSKALKGFKQQKLRSPICILRSLLPLSGKWIEVEVNHGINDDGPRGDLEW